MLFIYATTYIRVKVYYYRNPGNGFNWSGELRRLAETSGAEMERYSVERRSDMSHITQGSGRIRRNKNL